MRARTLSQRIRRERIFVARAARTRFRADRSPARMDGVEAAPPDEPLSSAFLSNAMRCWRFLARNAFGRIAWATLVAVLAYEFGRAPADATNHFGLMGGIVVAVC
jgi:hypothetical protein